MTTAKQGSPMQAGTPADLPTGIASRFPTAYPILFGLILFMAALTWFVPAGQYDRVQNEALGREVAVPGIYKAVEAAPQSLFDIFLAPVNGFYSQSAGTANVIDVSLFVFIIGSFLGVVNSTGAINAGIARAMSALRGREKWMIPIMMALFAAGAPPTAWPKKRWRSMCWSFR
jgi:uncharacterized ion transporter superfamily protein YfcC